MRTSLLVISVSLLACIVNVQAQRLNGPGSTPNKLIVNDLQKAITEPPLVPVSTKGDAPKTQGLDYTFLWTTDSYPIFETMTTNRVILFEPVSNSLTIVRNNRIITNNNLTGGQVRLYISTNVGSSWAEAEVLNKNGTVFAMPNMAISNKDNAVVDPLGLNWCIYGYTYDEVNEWRRTSQLGIFKTTGAPFDFEMTGPEDGNDEGFTWNAGDIVGVSGENPTAYFASILGSTPQGQYGTYGMWSFDFTTEDFAATQIPSQWDVNQFFVPSTKASTYNDYPRIAADADGSVYVTVNNFPAGSDPKVSGSQRFPGISRSDDQGVTWTSFDMMPQAVLDAYMNAQGWQSINVFGSYEQEALVATGPNKASLFFRVGQFVSGTGWTNLDIVEASYDNGTWTMTRVAELSGIPVAFQRHDSLSTLLEGPTGWVATYDANPLGHEIEAALTPDRQNILVKWIDENPSLGAQVFAQQETVYQFNQTTNQWQAVQLDSMYTTDVYFTVRKVSNATWGEKVNLTNDMAYDHGTKIPAIIPSLTQVPMLSLDVWDPSKYNQQYSLLPAIQALPPVMLDAHIDYRTPNDVNYTTFNAVNPTSVNEESNVRSFRIENVTPNPANEKFDVTYSMDVPGNVNIDVYSTAGNKVLSVASENVGVGIHGRSIDSSLLPSGAYYIILSVAGQQSATPLNIVK